MLTCGVVQISNSRGFGGQRIEELLEGNIMKTKTEDIMKIIDEAIKKYYLKPIQIRDKVYNLRIFEEDEDINFFQGFLFSEIEKKSELSFLIRRYRIPMGGYVPRMCLLIHKNCLFIKDYCRNKLICKTLEEIDCSFISKLNKALYEPTESNFKELLGVSY